MTTMDQIQKSLVNGKFVRAVDLAVDQRKNVGGYKKLKGVSAADKQFKVEHEARKKVISEHLDNKPGEHGEIDPLYRARTGSHARGATFRVGSKKQGKSYMASVAMNQKDLASTMAHERAHGAPKRSEYRLHGQVLKDPEKLLREEARADMAPGAPGHYQKQRRAAKWTGKPLTVYASGKPNLIRRAYPNMSDAEAKRGTKAYQDVQNKIQRARGGPVPWSTKKKVLVTGGATTAVGAAGAGGYVANQKRQQKKVA